MENDPIDAVRSQPQPPEALEERIMRAVRVSGAMRPHRSRRAAWLAAAAAVIFIAGVGAGRLWRPVAATDEASDRTRYMLLLAGDVTPSTDGGNRSAEYGAWARSVSATGMFVRGAELSPAAHLVGVASAPSLARALASVGGYFIVEAATEAEAIRLAETCPHVKYGGAIQVRKLL